MIPEKQKEFVKSLQTTTLGRYIILYLTIIGIIGDEDIKKNAQSKFGRPDYSPSKRYPTKEEAEIMIYAVEQGVSAERLGKSVPKTFLRNHPDIIKGINRENIIDFFVSAWDSESELNEKSIEILERGPSRAVLARKFNPLPCDFFKGAILGLFEVINVPCKVRETKCQWKDPDQHACVYEVIWE